MIQAGRGSRPGAATEAATLRGKSLTGVLIVAVGVLLASGADAQQSPSRAKAAKPAGKAAAPAMILEPRAIELLKATSARLAAAHTMRFTAVVSYESPSVLGPTLLFTTRSEVTFERPDKLKVLTPGDGPAAEFYYDGKTITAFAPAENLVAVADAPPTLEGALKLAFNSAAIYFPFTDLIVPDPYAMIADGLKLAFYIGRSNVVGGTTTEMVAFATDGVFVQVWIGAEDKLPRRMRATYRADPLRLRHDMELSGWELDQTIAPDAFAAQGAHAAKRIEFADPTAKLPAGARPPAKSKAPPQAARTQAPKPQ